MITIIGRKEVSTEEGFGWGVLEGPCLELQKQNPAIIASVYLLDDKRTGTVPLHYHFPTTSGLRLPSIPPTHPPLKLPPNPSKTTTTMVYELNTHF